MYLKNIYKKRKKKNEKKNEKKEIITNKNPIKTFSKKKIKFQIKKNKIFHIK